MQKVNEFSEFYKKNSTCKKTMKMKLKLTKMIFRYLLSLSDYAKKKLTRSLNMIGFTLKFYERVQNSIGKRFREVEMDKVIKKIIVEILNCAYKVNTNEL